MAKLKSGTRIFGTAQVDGNLSVSGNIILSSNIILSANSTVSNVIPTSNNTYYLGSATNTWRNLYSGNATITNSVSTLANITTANISVANISSATITQLDSTNITTLVGTLANITTANITTGNVGTLYVGNGSSAGNINSNGTANLRLATYQGTASQPSITLVHSANGNVLLTPSGVGSVQAQGNLLIGTVLTDGNISTLNNRNLWLTTNQGTTNSYIKLNAGSNGNIDVVLNGTGALNVSKIRFGDNTSQTTAYNIGGSNTHVQYNSSGSLAGSSNFTYDAATNQVTIGGNLLVSGNMTVSGSATTINSSSLQLDDPMIYLAHGNPGDVLDVGFVSSIKPSMYQHTGFVRDASDGVWKLFANVVTEPSTVIDFTDATYSNLYLGNITAQHIGNFNSISVTNGITGNLLTASQTNITEVGTLSSLAVSGNITSSSSVVASSLTGTLLTASQTNITAVGTLSTLTVSGNITASSSINVTGSITSSASIVATGSISSSAAITATGNVSSSYYEGTGVSVTNAAMSGTLNVSGLTTLANVTTANLYSTSLGVGTTASGNVGEIRATNAITAYYSDRRLKTNIVPISDALSKVKQLSGVLYTQNELAEQYGYHDYSQQVGVFAQDVQLVQPEVVKPAPFDIAPDGSSLSGENYLTVQYDKLVPLLIEAIKELEQEVSRLKGSL